MHPFNGPLSGTTQVSRYQKGYTNLDLLEQETVSGSVISWAICESAPRPKQITMPVPHHSVFYRLQMPFLPPNNSIKALKADVLATIKLKNFTFHSYNVAFVCAECSEIFSGSVFLYHNNYLCFDDTIEWRDILSGEGAEVLSERRRLRTCKL